MARRQNFGKVTLVYGARNPEDFAFMKEFENWKKANIKVVLSASKPGSGWKGETGHIEVHFGKEIKALSRPISLICGMKAMQQESRDELIKLGIPAEEVLTNY